MITAAVSNADNFWVFVGLLAGLGFLDLLALLFILVLSFGGQSPQKANTIENLWRLIFTVTAALLGLLGGKSLG